MKKISRKELKKLLSTNQHQTYDELAKITGYHPKSLIRIKSQMKKGKYFIHNNTMEKLGKPIQDDYKKSGFKYYKDFYNATKEKYHISYSMMCRILSLSNQVEEIVFIKTFKENERYYYYIIDYQSHNILFKYIKGKNNVKDISKIIYKLLNEFGSPKYISFVNFYRKLSPKITYLLDKYKIEEKIYKPIYSHALNSINISNNNIKYKKLIIDKRDFYEYIMRSTIADNTIQFNNIRYHINTSKKIAKNTRILLYFNEYKDDVFIMHNNEQYSLTPYLQLSSKKGLSKY